MNKKLANFTNTQLEHDVITLLVRVQRFLTNLQICSDKTKKQKQIYLNAQEALFLILAKIRKGQLLAPQQHVLIHTLQQDPVLPPALFQHVKTEQKYYVFGPLTKQIDVSNKTMLTRLKRYSLVAEYDLSTVDQQQTKKPFNFA